jgi:hypothetical protein
VRVYNPNSMPWIEPVSTVVTAAELASELAKSSTFIRKQARRLVFRIRNGKALIPIFGAGGVGKSTVSKLLGGQDPLSMTAAYEPSAAVEHIEMEGNVPGQFLAAPGQTERVRYHWPDLFKKLSTGKSFGFINVVAYGYHSLKIPSYTQHDEYRVGMTASDFAQAYSKARRAVELEMLQTVVNGLSAVTTPVWMVTLVNKQDLWWHDLKAVRKHYEEGEYAAKVGQMEKSIGSKSFQHELLPVSFAMNNLGSDDGALFAETSKGYDLPTHLRYLRSTFTLLNALIDGGRKR